MLDLGFSAINSMDLREVAVPHLQALSDETGRTVNMAVLDGADIVYIERCRTSQSGQRDIDLNLHIGSRLPAYCTSMGKVLLAGLEPERQREVLEQVQFTQRGPERADRSSTSCSPSSSACGIAGLAVNNEELAYGLRSIAAPVRSQTGEVVAAINLAVHRTMVSLDSLVAHLGPQLKQTAAEISARIGYQAGAERPERRRARPSTSSSSGDVRSRRPGHDLVERRPRARRRRRSGAPRSRTPRRSTRCRPPRTTATRAARPAARRAGP